MSKVKFLSTDDFFRQFNSFIQVTYKGYRTKKDGQRIRTKSIEKYEYSLQLLKQFHYSKSFEIRLYIIKNLNSKEMEKARKHWKQFYIQFTKFLYEDKKHYDNYVGTTIKNIRTFFNYLNNEKMLGVGTFHKQFYVPKEDIQITVLSPNQLRTLIQSRNTDLGLGENLELVRDVFIFGCTVALRYSDIMNLRSHNIIQNENGFYLKVKSQKTDYETILKLPNYALDIIGKYKGKRNTLFPFICNAYFNIQLKKLGKFILQDQEHIKYRTRQGKPVIIYKNAIKKVHFRLVDHLTTHTMRRTAITTMLRLGMPEQSVRKISGHAAYSKEFFKYIAYSQSYLDIESDLVFEKLTSPK